MNPTVGRVVYYKSYGTPGGEYPSVDRAAIITAVHNATCVDLCVMNPTGLFFNQKVVQGSNGGQWDWMPYQKGQAAKTEQLEQKLREGKLPAEQIARLCHEVNRAFCRSIGDDSQPAWDDAPDWQTQSAINGVKFHLENETTPEMSHESWMAEKLADGWTYGSAKDPGMKKHPCMVPYEQLPLEQRTKDYLFKAIVDTCK
jgi:hypothetical protein